MRMYLVVFFMVLSFMFFSFAFGQVSKTFNNKQVMIKMESNATSKEICTAISGLSKSFMLNRQENTPIEVVRNEYMKAKPNQNLIEIFEYILTSAYKHPVLESMEDKNEMIERFSKMMENSCYHVHNDNQTKGIMI